MLKPEKKWCVGDRKFNTELEAQAYADDENAKTEIVDTLLQTVYESDGFVGNSSDAQKIAIDVVNAYFVTPRT